MEDEGESAGLGRAASSGRIYWRKHALSRCFEREISRSEVLHALAHGKIIERYPDDHPFPSCLILLVEKLPLHVVAALDPETGIAHIITVYRPDTSRFEPDWTTRRKPDA
ncbi:MAG: DUF4258 domain-containing protein [Candidatus Hydrogenedens sp.]|nr:DUF4258 domain-containing protein [Candidatus Hydrogenedens sp.]